jgi:hypothetical protein
LLREYLPNANARTASRSAQYGNKPPGLSVISIADSRALFGANPLAVISAPIRQAQLEFLNPGSRYQHPFFWAPFILMGNRL